MLHLILYLFVTSHVNCKNKNLVNAMRKTQMDKQTKEPTRVNSMVPCLIPGGYQQAHILHTQLPIASNTLQDP